jgi:hypothetical protein
MSLKGSKWYNLLSLYWCHQYIQWLYWLGVWWMWCQEESRPDKFKILCKGLWDSDCQIVMSNYSWQFAILLNSSQDHLHLLTHFHRNQHHNKCGGFLPEQWVWRTGIRDQCDNACAALAQIKVRSQKENWENTVSMVSLNFITATWNCVQCHSHIWVTYVYTHEIITTYIASSTSLKKKYSLVFSIKFWNKNSCYYQQIVVILAPSLRNDFRFLHSFT